MNTKRFLIILLVSTFVTMIFASCQPAQSTAGSTTTKATLLTTGGTTTQPEEPVKLSLFIEAHPAVIDFKDNDATRWAEEKLNIDFEFNVAPQGSALEKMNIILNSGVYPDIFYRAIPDEVIYGIESGIIIELSDFIPQMEHLSKQLTDYPFILNQMKAIDGNIYAFPGYNDCYHCNYPAKAWYNTMRFEDLGIDLPTTTDEFYDALKLFKEKYPDDIPFAGCISADPIQYITNAFTYFPAGTNWQIGLVVEGGKTIDTMINSDGYRESLRYLNKLYAEKLLYEGTFTMANEQMSALLAEEGEPVLFYTAFYNVQFVNPGNTPELYAHQRGLAPLAGPDGTRYASYNYNNVTPAFAISKTCANPEKAVAFADLHYYLEGFMIMLFGTQGIDWDLPTDGAVGLDGRAAVYRRLRPYSLEPNKSNWEPTGLKFDVYSNGMESNPNPNFDDPADGATMRYQTTADLYVPYKPVDNLIASLPPIKFTKSETEDIKTAIVTLKSYIEQSRVAFITGEKSIDTDWDSYVKTLNDLGMANVIKIHQDAYDRVYK